MIFKTFTCESENGLCCDVHIMRIFECRYMYVHPRGPGEGHLSECLPAPAYALACQYVTPDTRRPQRSSWFCLNDVRAADESICGLGSAAF